MRAKVKVILYLPIFIMFAFIMSIGNVFVTATTTKDFNTFSNEYMTMINNQTGSSSVIRVDKNDLTDVNGVMMIDDTSFKSLTKSSITRNDDEVIITHKNQSILLSANSDVAYVGDDTNMVLSENVQIKDNTILFPVENISSALGFTITEQESAFLLTREYQTHRLIISSKYSIDYQNASYVASGYDNLYILQYDTEEQTEKAYEYYKTLDYIDYVCIDSVVTTSDYDAQDFTEEDYTTWGADTTGAIDYSNYLNGVGINNLNDVVIAVLDTGIDTDHEYFTGRIQSGGKSFVSGSNGYEDDHGHGTHVSGIIADLTLSNVKILPIKILDSTGSGSDSAIIMAMNYVRLLTNMNICAINMSLGGTSTAQTRSMYNTAIQNALNAGIVSVVAAGNDGQDTIYATPANIAEAITVSAIGQREDGTLYRPYWSNYGDEVDVCAPGLCIESAKMGGGTVVMSGTSMATPHVSGIIGLLCSNHTYTVNELIDEVKNNAQDIGTLGEDILYGFGVVSVKNAQYSLLEDEILFSNTNTEITEAFDLSLSFTIPSDLGNYTCGIYYTIDGSQPSLDNGTLYESVINISASTQVKAIAFIKNNNNEVKYYTKVYAMNYCLNGQDINNAYVVNEGKLVEYRGMFTEITLPTNITSIDEYVFTSTLVESVIIPSDSLLTKIDKCAFFGCVNFSEIIAPTITQVDGYAFASCNELTELTSDNFPALEIIGPYAFYNCCNLYSVELDTVTEIGDYAFQNEDVSSSLNSISFNNVEKIGKFAFSKCIYLDTISIPKVVIIGSNAFEYCSIEELSLNNLQHLGSQAFLYNDIVTINLPQVLTIGGYAFYYDEVLESVTLPRVENIGTMAFAYTSITELSLPNIITVDSLAFTYSEIENIDISNALYIKEGAFEGCINLMEIDLSNAIYVSAFAFSGCENLKKVTLSGCLSNIFDDSFADCDDECVFYIDTNTIALDFVTKHNCVYTSILNSYNFSYIIKDNQATIVGYCLDLNANVTIPKYTNDNIPITKIGKNAFKNCSVLKTINLSDVITIEKGAFENCSNLSSVIGLNLNIIQENAFKNCDKLESVKLNNVSTIGDYAFYNCEELGEITFINDEIIIGEKALGFLNNDEKVDNFTLYGYAGGNADIYATTNDFNFTSLLSEVDYFYYDTYTNNENTEIVIKGICENTVGEIIIPSTYKGYTVSKIGEEAFKDNSLITSVVLPNTITTIDNNAFSNCINLKNINLDYVTTIGEQVFLSCHSIEYVYMPLVEKVSVEAFEDCISMIEIDIPGATEIDMLGIYGCTMLQTVNCPNVTKIGYKAFSHCLSLTNITLQNVETLGNSALDIVNFPNDYGDGYNYIFEDCYNLKKLYLPNIVMLYKGITANSSVEKVFIGSSLSQNISTRAFNDLSIYALQSNTVARQLASYGRCQFVALNEFMITQNLDETKNINKFDDLTLSVIANGNDQTYQWFTTNSDVENGTAIIGAISNELVINTNEVGTTKYFVKITNWDNSILVSDICEVTIADNNKYSIIASSSCGGSISDSGTNIVDANSNKTFTFNIGAGYKVSEILVDTIALSNDDMQNAVENGYTFTNVTQNHTIEVKYEVNTYEITIIQAENGTIGNEKTIYIGGSDTLFTITANAGYHITKVIVDGEDIEANDTNYVFENLSSNHTLSAEFAMDYYVINITIDDTKGTIVCENDESLTDITYGESRTFMVASCDGYVLSKVYVNGKSVVFTDGKFTIENIDKNITIQPIFTKDNAKIAIDFKLILLVFAVGIIISLLIVIFYMRASFRKITILDKNE